MFCWIYKLIHKEATNDDMVYIGSTCDVDGRMKTHKSHCTNPNDIYHHYKVYKYIRENGGWEEWKYEILDEIEVPLKECEERYKYEDEYIRRYDAINKLNRGYNIRTSKQYREDNKEKIREWQREYYEKNANSLNEKKKEWRKNNIDIIKERKKEYYEKNADYICEKAKLNYEKNKDKINERLKEKICCDICKCVIRKDVLTRHQRTQKCINFKNLTI